MESKNFIPKCPGHTNQVVLTNHSIILDVILPNRETFSSTNRCWTQKIIFGGLPLTTIQRITSTSMHGNLFANQMEAWNSKISKEPTPPQLIGWTKFNFDAVITRTLILYHTFYLNWKGHCPLTGSSGSKGHSRFQHLNHKPMSQVRLFWRRCQNFHWFNKQPDLRIEWDFSLNCKRYLILCLIIFFSPPNPWLD